MLDFYKVFFCLIHIQKALDHLTTADPPHEILQFAEYSPWAYGECSMWACAESSLWTYAKSGWWTYAESDPWAYEESCLRA